jgi:hypothetical protein
MVTINTCELKLGHDVLIHLYTHIILNHVISHSVLQDLAIFHAALKHGPINRHSPLNSEVCLEILNLLPLVQQVHNLITDQSVHPQTALNIHHSSMVR